MHDPVPDCDRIDFQLLAQPGAGCAQGEGHIGNVVGLESSLDEFATISTTRAQTRLRADPIYLAPDLNLQIIRTLDGENLELHAR